MTMLMQMAFRNIFRQRRRSLLTGLTIAGGYFLLSILQGIAEGSYAHMIRIFTQNQTGHMQIHHPEYVERPGLRKTLPEDAGLYSQLKTIDGITGVSPRIHGWGLAYHDPKSIPVPIEGIQPDSITALTTLDERIQQGRMPGPIGQKPTGNAEALIGLSLAKLLKLGVGDELIIISQAADGSVANAIFDVVGLVGSETSHDRQTVYLNLTAAQEFFLLPNKVHEFMIMTDDPEQARRLVPKIKAQKPFDDWTVRPWQEIEKDFYQTMEADKQGNNVVNGILVFMISIGVLNTVFMMILERGREYGILKALGTHSGQILTLIFWEIFFLTIISIGAGLCLSLPLNLYLSHNGIKMPHAVDIGGLPYDTILSEISWLTVAGPAVYLLVVISIMSLLPAWRAATKNPLRALVNM
jgi:ABC-type lipoprotein release transport system permease subunit